MRRLYLFCRNIVWRFLNLLTKKDKNTVFFIPHVNCKNDGYDVINYRSDNVLCLINYMTQSDDYTNYSLNILVYREDKDDTYINYMRERGFKGTINIVHDSNDNEFIKAFTHSYYIFTDEFYRTYPYKVKKQKTICLGYYAAPFKDDFWRVARKGFKQATKDRKHINEQYDYYITSSDFCSREISVDTQLFLPKFFPFGFPRNSVFYEDNTEIKNKIISVLGFVPKHIITYAPTHRDYEKDESLLHDDNLTHSRTLFGNSSVEEENKLIEFLENENAIIIAKVHPYQSRSNLIKTANKRIFFYSDLSEKCIVSLQELLAISDMLITDYSSTFYDFLLTGRPIVHYCYDYDIQLGIRGFAYNPVIPFAAGSVVYSFNDLCKELKGLFTDGVKNTSKMDFIRSIIYLHLDGDASARIANFFFKS